MANIEAIWTRSLNGSNTGHSESSMLLDQEEPSPLRDTCLSSSSSSSSSEPLCRQFWKAGNFDNNGSLGSEPNRQNWQNHLHVHPMFLHSNATSHKWAFGAIAELLDNAIDEIQNGATFVAVDKITNPRDGSSALLFQDDGGGMSPEAMRRCMSFGFTNKNTQSDIGKYGNGFKTSTMRLGADVIVFSRHLHERILTQSIGLLSYSFLRKAGYDRIVVPMVHYEYNTSTDKLEFLHGKEHFMSNLSMLLQWSPYPTEPELLQQFVDIGDHGTKVIIYNLWFTDDGIEELDFNTDPKDIRTCGDTKQIEPFTVWKTVNEQHIGNRFAFSLRVYLSILYLRLPESFKIILRGEVVKHHNIADDLKHPEYILYKPLGRMEAQVITTIGFLKESPQVNVHGFNVYYKNRLILPFWRVVGFLNGKGRGVVGVLEANFVEPTHNKQDFEKTSIFQKLETRWRDMTCEYWDLHCGLLGYCSSKTLKAQTVRSISTTQMTTISDQNPSPVFVIVPPRRFEGQLSDSPSKDRQELHMKRKRHGNVIDIEEEKQQAMTRPSMTELERTTGNQRKDHEAANLIFANQKLLAKCLEYEEEEKRHNLKVEQLKTEIKEIENNYARLLGELQAMETTKPENGVENTPCFVQSHRVLSSVFSLLN